MSGGFTSVRVLGGLLPSDVLASVSDGSAAGLSTDDFHLGGERPREAAARTWSHLLGVYQRFRSDLSRLRADDPAVSVTRERWLTQLLATFDYGRVPATGPGGITVDDRQYPVSHVWGATPLHLLGWGVALDTRTPGVPGAAKRAPHAMVQELLNRSTAYRWAVVSNGRVLRLLRDSTSLTGQSYVEFDLEAIFDGELYADYVLLYLLVHQSRLEESSDHPGENWLERWRTTAVNQGVRALNLLRDGVQQALQILGTGFLQHPANSELRGRLETGELPLDDLHQSLLRTVYRLLFWSVAEDREALLDPAADSVATDRYREHFSSARLRDRARRRHGSAHHDLWDGVTVVFQALRRTEGEPRLGLPGLGGLFYEQPGDPLAVAKLGNQPLLAAVRCLSIVQPKGQPRRIVDFRHLGAEELGSIYESLLELVPRRDPLTHTFSLEAAAGNDRKKSGSYYTPSDLVELVLDTALDPVLDAAEKQPDPEAALLAVTVCDPAIGSGHFVVAAARRIANRVAMVRSGEIDPTPTTLADAVHDVVNRCIYGVDINPMAADLAKVSLWMEAMAPGRPLSFLDHHIKVGNSLLGTTPALLQAGIPDAAYVALTGDDKPTVRAWKKLNTEQRSGQASLLDEAAVEVSNEIQRTGTEEVAERVSTAASLGDVTWAAQRYATLQAGEGVARARRAADSWCAAFLTPKTKDSTPIAQDTLIAIAEGRGSAAAVESVEYLARRHRLFHWHLEFPEIFRVPATGAANTPAGWTGGFSAVLGNPPWERVKLQEQEFFAARDPKIAEAANAAARKKAIKALVDENPDLSNDFQRAKRHSEAESQFLRTSGRYPLCGVGDVNVYSVFAECFQILLDTQGRSGVLTPSGLCTGDTTSAFIRRTLRLRRLAAFFEFANHKEKLFPDLKGQSWFAITVTSGGERIESATLASDLALPSEVKTQQFQLSTDEILELNPNTGTLPLFRTRRDAEITLSCYRRHPVLRLEGNSSGNPWSLNFLRLFDMANDAGAFQTAEELECISDFDGWAWRHAARVWLPLYEGKMLTIYNDRFGDFTTVVRTPGKDVRAIPTPSNEELDDPSFAVSARYWVDSSRVEAVLGSRWTRPWLLGWRDITNTTNARTFVACVLPRSAVNHVFPIVIPTDPGHGSLLQSVWSSMIFDYISRQKLSGTHMTYSVVTQLSCPLPSRFFQIEDWSSTSMQEFLEPRVLELTYNSSRMRDYAFDVLGAEPGAPYRWIPERRAALTAEIDAAMLHLYELDRGAAEHVIDSFARIRKSDEKDYGEFRTKRLVLTAYDAMAQAAETGLPFRSPLDPPPGEGPRHKEAAQ